VHDLHLSKLSCRSLCTSKVTAPIPEGLSNSACFQVEAIHETIFNAFAIENPEFSNFF
jgi:hypothetical protein